MFAGMATATSIFVKYSKGIEEDPLMVFLACELFGYGLAAFIFVVAIIEGFTKAKIVLRQFNMIPERVRKHHSIELVKKPLNPKYWFMQFQIVQQKNGEYYELDERTKREILDNWL